MSGRCNKDDNSALRGKVRNLYTKIVLEIDPNKILDLLFQKRIITIEMKSQIMSQKTKPDRCRALLDQLFSSSNDEAFIVFRQAIEECYPWIVKQIDNCEIDNEYDTEEKRKHSAMREQIIDVYEQLVSEVDPGDILDFLIQKRIVTVERRKELMSRTTRQERCRTLIDQMLNCSHEEVFTILIESLKERYPWIVEGIDTSKTGDESTCQSVKDIKRRLEQTTFETEMKRDRPFLVGDRHKSRKTDPVSQGRPEMNLESKLEIAEKEIAQLKDTVEQNRKDNAVLIKQVSFLQNAYEQAIERESSLQKQIDDIKNSTSSHNETEVNCGASCQGDSNSNQTLESEEPGKPSLAPSSDLWLGVTEIRFTKLQSNIQKRIPRLFFREVNILKRLNHPNVVKIFDYSSVAEPFYIVIEGSPESNLEVLLREDEAGTISLQFIAETAMQIAAAMEYVGLQKIVHRDLRAENILLDAKKNVKVSNFERAIEQESHDLEGDCSEEFPIRWSAPEIFIDVRNGWTTASDVWSFGVILYEMFTNGNTPYAAKGNDEVVDLVQSGYRLPLPTDGKIECPSSVYKTMLSCWDAEPEQRPSFLKLQVIFLEICKESEIVSVESDLPKDMEIISSELSLQKKVDTIDESTLWRGTWKDKVVCVKTFPILKKYRHLFFREAQILHRLEHQNVVKLLGIISLVQPLRVVMECVPESTLLQLLRKDQGITFKFIVDKAMQIAKGMEYLALQKILHRDIRANTILLYANNIAKVSNFGRAVRLELLEFEDSSKLPFAVRWTDPEVFVSNRLTSFSDVWSFGVLLYEMFTAGKLPYIGKSNREVVLSLVEENYRLPCPKKCKVRCPDSIYQIMLSCWNSEPEQRPNFSKLRSIFQGFCKKS